MKALSFQHGFAWRGCAFALAFVLLSASSCSGKPSADDIERWQTTENGSAKLREVIGNPEVDPEVRARAAAALIQINEWPKVRDTLQAIGDGPARRVVQALVPQLEQAAETPEGFRPSPAHIAAKDALFDVRTFAGPDTRKRIDTFLAEWVGASFDNRQSLGRAEGLTVVKAAGAQAAPPLLAAVRSNIAAPPDAQGRVPLTSDELLKALAYTGDPEAVELLLDIGSRDHVEPTLRKRATAALYVAYVDDVEPPRPNPAALQPHVDKLADVAKDPNSPGSSINDAVALIAAAGLPACREPALRLVRHPGPQEAFRWMALREAIACTGVDGVVEAVEALPPGKYPRVILEKYVWKKVREAGNRGQVAQACRDMLDSRSPIARVTGVECLGDEGEAADAARLQALFGDRAPLPDWWVEEGVPESQRKKDPTVGQVAQTVAKRLGNR